MNTQKPNTRHSKSSSLFTKGVNRPLRIAVCPPELRLLKRVMEGEVADATFIIQAYIADGLQSRGYQLNFVGSDYPEGAIYSGKLEKLQPAQLTWTGTWLFELIRKLVWRMQHFVGIPYLNIFSNLRLMDACLQTLPGNDLVYERSTLYRFGVAMACRRLGMPYILYVEADDILEHDIMKKPITGVLRLLASKAFNYNLASADRVVCVSKPLKLHLAKKWKVPADKIVVIPNVAEVNRFKPNPDARNDVRLSWGIGEAPLVLFVGNFFEWHDVATLLRSFVRVLKSHPEARLMLVGDGAKRQAMTQLALELGIDHSVIFTGMVAHTDVPCLMAAADVAVVPYPDLDQDVWLSPLKLFEFMATGNAIIASSVGQMSEWIITEQNGLLVSPGDISAMAAGIDRLIGDPELRVKLGENARAQAIQKHSWDRYLSDLEDVYFSVLGKDTVS